MEAAFGGDALGFGGDALGLGGGALGLGEDVLGAPVETHSAWMAMQTWPSPAWAKSEGLFSRRSSPAVEPGERVIFESPLTERGEPRTSDSYWS